jgi:hypothetical protein
MACKPKYKTAEASTKYVLRKEGVIDKYLNVIDYAKFVKLNNQWSKNAEERFAVTGNLFSTNAEGTRAFPNKEIFRAIDRAKNINYPEDTTRIVNIRPGVNETFKNNATLVSIGSQEQYTSYLNSLTVNESPTENGFEDFILDNKNFDVESILKSTTQKQFVQQMYEEEDKRTPLPPTGQETVFESQKEENNITESSTASPEVLAIVKDFLDRVGFNYTGTDKVWYKGRPLNANGIAEMANKLIQVLQGKEATTLPEEAMHVFVEIIQQTNKPLFNQLLKEINNYQILDKVYAQYGNDSLYQNKDGSRNILKLKKEAIAKVLVETIIKQREGSTEKSELLDKVQQDWWEKFKNWLNNLLTKSGFDSAALDIIHGVEIGTAEDIRSREVFLQKTEQERVVDSIRENGAGVELRLNEEEEVERWDYWKGDHKISTRVSDKIYSWYKKRMQERAMNEEEFTKATYALKAEKGTLGHKDFEHAFELFVDENGYIKSEEERQEAKIEDDRIYRSQMDPDDDTNEIYLILRENMENRLLSYGANTVFMAEQVIYDKERDLAGTVDFIAVEENGDVNLLDWKFMDLNTDRWEDVPWFKVSAWQQQMEQYKYILGRVNNIKSAQFKHTRMIPIKTHYSKANRQTGTLPRLLEIEIGDVKVENINEDYLLPVGLETETTGNARIDELLVKLNAVYQKLGKAKALPSEKLDKNEQLNALYTAIRQLQMKQNIIPLIRQAQLILKQVDRIEQKFEQVFLDEDGKAKDARVFEQDVINSFARTIEDARQALEVYVDLKEQLEFLFEGELSEADKKLEKSLTETISSVRSKVYHLRKLDERFTEEVIGGSEKVKGLLGAEKVVKGVSKWFSSTNTIQMKSMETLYKKVNKVFGYAAMDTRDQIHILEKHRLAYMKWAQGKGLRSSQYFDIIKKQDEYVTDEKTGKKTKVAKNELIDEFNPEFYKELRAQQEDRNFTWVLDNIDTVEYRKYLAEKLAEEIERIENKNRVGTDEEIANEIKWETKQAEADYSTDNKTSFGWMREEAKKFPVRDKWESDAWKTLNAKGNEAPLAFYNYIKERNEYYKSIGYIHAREARVFLPWVRKGLTEKLIFGGNVTMGEQFLRNITVDESDIGYGQINPLTGKPLDVVPIMLTSKLDVDYSTDLFKTMGLYNEFAIKFKYITDVEAQARALVRLERNKNALATSVFGKTQRVDGDGQAKEIEDNSSNAELLEDMVKAIIYQQKYISSESFDQVLGRLGKMGEKVNNKIGFKLLPEKMEGRVFSINKTITQINNSYQMIALGFNVLSATSNYFGGKSQGFINSGKYFTKAQYLKTELWLLGNKMGGEDKQKALAALEYFLPFTDNFNREANSKLSISKLNQESVQDFLMFMMRNSDKAVQTTNFFAYFNNSIIQDGQVVNAREYLRTLPEYEDMFAGTQAEREARQIKFEKDVADIIEKQGVKKLSSVDEDGKLVIPGVDRKSQSVIELRRKVQSFTSDALGNMTEEGKRKIQMSVYGKSAMVFKSWIPRLVDVRVGNLKYNAASDAYEWGRTRMIAEVLMTDVFKSLGLLKGAILGYGDGNIEFMRDAFEKKKTAYELDTGKDLDMTESEFIALMEANVKNQLMDTLMMISLWALFLGLKGIMPDDDEDPRVLARWRFALKAVDKLRDELGYFYNPANIFQLFKRGIFPSTGLIDNYSKSLSGFGKEMYGIYMEDEKMVKDNKVIKYWLKSFPVTSQFQAFLPMFAPELSKELGIRTRSRYGM